MGRRDMDHRVKRKKDGMDHRCGSSARAIS